MSAKRAVSQVRAPEAEPKVPKVRAVQLAALSAEKQAPPTTVVPTEPARVAGVRPSLEAWQRIAYPLRSGKGIRVVVYGITGKGKTTGLKEFLALVLREQLIDLALIHDVKFRDVQQYEGDVIHDARDVFTVEHAPESFPAVRVLRKRGLDHMPSVDGAARVTLEAANDKIRTMFIVDEFSRALEEDVAGGFNKGSCNRIACEGLGIGASLIAVKQLPQYMPTGVRSQSDLVFFGTGGDGVTFFVDEKILPKKYAELVGRLDVGQFIVKPCEGDIDGHVYQVPAP